MATLQNAQIDQTYQALLKAGDNGAITATPKAITDGAGNATNILMSNTATNFASGTVDFTGATVSGLPTATAGLELGTGTNALQNAIGSASTASGAQSIALGAGALASGGQSMAYGDQAQATSTSAASFGQYAEATATYAIAFGRTSTATADGAVAFGQQTSAAQAGAVAMGRQVQSDTADTTHVRALKIVAPDGGTGGNGITMLSPDGTAGVVTLTNNSELAVDGTPIGGGGGAAGLESGTGTDSMQSAAALTTTGAAATGDGSIVLGNNTLDGGSDKCVILGNDIDARVATNDTIAIGQSITGGAFNGGNIAIGKSITFSGRNSTAIGDNITGAPDEAVIIGRSASSNAKAVAIGKSANASGDKSVAVGFTSTASGDGAVALGDTVTAAIAQTVSIKALEVQTDSTPTAGGIIMSDAGGTDRRLNITASGALQVDGTAVGGATQFELPAFTVPANAASDICYAVVTIPANTFAAGDILELRALEKRDSLNNTVYESYWFSEQSQTVGSAVQAGTAYQQAGIQTADNGSTYYQKTMWIDATNTTVFPYGTANETSSQIVTGGDPVESQAVDWTVTQYFYYQGWSDATVGTVENFGTLLRKIN